MAILDTNLMLKEMGLPNLPTPQWQRYDALRQAVEQAVKEYLKWPVEETAATEFYCGNAMAALPLLKPFVSAVGSVYLDPTGAWGQGANAFAASVWLRPST